MIYKIPTQIDLAAKPLPRKLFNKPKQGVECMFVQLDNKTGVKIFPTKGAANYSYQRQKKAYQHGIAPEVYGNIEKCLVNNLIEWDLEAMFCNGYGLKKHGYFYRTEVAKVGGVQGKELLHLESIMKELRFSAVDLHRGNIGKIKGRPVVIDFGRRSTGR